MRTVLLGCTLVLGLTGGCSLPVTPATEAQAPQGFVGFSADPIVSGNRWPPSYANPTGQVTYGADGAISLFQPSDGGRG